MATDLGQDSARQTALRWAQDHLATVLSVSDALEEPVLAAHVSLALETAKSLLIQPMRRS